LTTLTTTTIWHPLEPPLLNDILRLAQIFTKVAGRIPSPQAKETENEATA